MTKIRRFGIVILALSALAVFVAMEPSGGDPSPSLPDFAPEASDYAELVDQALSDGRLNESFADSAPQQQVVNGWVARDLLAILALEGAQNVLALDVVTEQNELIYAALVESEQRDNRPAALLTIGVLMIALWGLTDERYPDNPPSPSPAGRDA